MQEESKKKTENLLLSLVIPAYNEELRLEKTLCSYCPYLKDNIGNHEVLIVDDGSTDRTGELVLKLKNEEFSSISLLSYPKNRGKGYAVRFGIENASGDRILIADADGATPIEELKRLVAAIKDGADIAIGSRALYSSDTQVKTALHRKILGRVFNGLVNLIVLPGIADTQCGFKLYRKEAAKYLSSRQQADGFSFDVEHLFIARRKKFKIAEVPINWTNIPGSKVNIIKDSTKMLLDIMKFRLFATIGRYD